MLIIIKFPTDFSQVNLNQARRKENRGIRSGLSVLSNNWFNHFHYVSLAFFTLDKIHFPKNLHL